jgi:hypothetical protein
MNGKRNTAEDFINFYESNGWMVSKNKMKSWESTVMRWTEPKPKVKANERVCSVCGEYGGIIKNNTRYCVKHS